VSDLSLKSIAATTWKKNNINYVSVYQSNGSLIKEQRWDDSSLTWTKRNWQQGIGTGINPAATAWVDSSSVVHIRLYWTQNTAAYGVYECVLDSDTATFCAAGGTVFTN